MLVVLKILGNFFLEMCNMKLSEVIVYIDLFSMNLGVMVDYI